MHVHEKKPPHILTMIQPPPLPGSFRHSHASIQAIEETVLAEVALVAELGFDGIILQNMNDMPVKQVSRPEAIAYMTRLACSVRTRWPQLRLGILVNWDGVAALAVADASAADFVRVEHLFTRAEITSAGFIQAQCCEIAETKKRIGSRIPIYADIYEAHGIHLAPAPVEDAAWEAVNEAFADGLFIGGVDDEERIGNIRKVRAKVGNIPCFLSGGATAENVGRLMQHYDGVSVATWIKNGDMKNPIDREKASKFLKNARSNYEGG